MDSSVDVDAGTPLAVAGGHLDVALHLASAADRVHDEVSFAAFMRREVGCVIPFRAALACIAAAHSLGFVCETAAGVDLRADFLESVAQLGGRLTSPAAARWYRNRDVALATPLDEPRVGPYWRHLARAVGAHNELAFGVLGTGETAACIVVLYGVDEVAGPLTRLALYALAPAVHAILRRLQRRAVPAAPSAVAPSLSEAERAVMRWLREGKSNTEIAQILGKSSRTVGNQVQSIFRKTGLNSRVLLARMPIA